MGLMAATRDGRLARLSSVLGVTLLLGLAIGWALAAQREPSASDGVESGTNAGLGETTSLLTGFKSLIRCAGNSVCNPLKIRDYHRSRIRESAQI